MQPSTTVSVAPADYGGSTSDFPSLSGFVYIDVNNNAIKDPG